MVPRRLRPQRPPGRLTRQRGQLRLAADVPGPTRSWSLLSGDPHVASARPVDPVLTYRVTIGCIRSADGRTLAFVADDRRRALAQELGSAAARAPAREAFSDTRLGGVVRRASRTRAHAR